MIIILLVVLLVVFIYRRRGLTQHNMSDDHNVENDNQTSNIDFTNAYQSKYFLTQNELHQYRKLKELADGKGYVVCPKVRLLDLIEPKRNHNKYKTLFYKIQAKHVDFVVCDENMRVKVIVELDDSSHNNKARKERDSFVDLILISVGYKIIHTKYITDKLLDTIWNAGEEQ